MTTERETVEAQAKALGITVRSNISTETLIERIDAAAAGDVGSTDAETVTAEEETPVEATRFRSIRIKEFVKDIGEGQTETVYACGGLHLSAEHRKMLPPIQISNLQGKTVEKHVRKIEPGKDYELPEDIALYYLKENRRFLEEVYE